MVRGIVLALGGGLLVLGGVGAVGALKGAPALVPEARVESVFGDWTVPVRSAFYNRSDYLFQLGFGYLQADLLVSGVTEARDELASIETALDRAARAEALLEESLALAPGNTHAWAALAWSRMILDKTEASVAAMQRSWALAPNNAQLAPSRLGFYDLVARIDSASAVQLEVAARNDLLGLQVWQPRLAETLMERLPTLPALVTATVRDAHGSG